MSHLEQGIVTEKIHQLRLKLDPVIWFGALRLGGYNTDTHAEVRDQIVWVWPRYITLFIHCSVSHNLTTCTSITTNKLENNNTIKRS